MNLNIEMPIATYLLASIGLLVIFSLLIYQLFYYKNHQLKVFSLRKIIIIGLFFAIYILQSYLTLLQSGDNFILVNFDSASIILLSWVFGPLEGLIYALLADNTRILVLGWLWQLLYALEFPMIALIAGTLGQIYRTQIKKAKTDTSDNSSLFLKHKYLYFGIIQLIILATYLGSILVAYFNPSYLPDNLVFNSLTIISLISAVILETIFFLLSYKQKYYQLDLLFFLFIIAVIFRWVIQIHYSTVADRNLWAPVFGEIYFVRIAKNAYLVPMMITVWFLLISFVETFLMKNHQNRW